MSAEQISGSNAVEESRGRTPDSLLFLLDKNLGLTVDEQPWTDLLASLGITAEATSDLKQLDQAVAEHQPDIAYIPCADFHRLTAKGDRHYRGLAIATSKFTGMPTLRSLLVVRKDDPANGLEDLRSAKYGYINKSCTSSYFPPAILLGKQGLQLDEFLKVQEVKAWQGQIDAVVAGEIRATMILEDVWKSSPKNDDNTKVIGHFDNGKPPVVVVREGLDESVCKILLDALTAWMPRWDAVYGGFKPFYYADVHSFFHELDQLPKGL